MKQLPRFAAAVSALVVAASSLVACADGEDSKASGNADSITLKVSTVFGPEHWHTQAFEEYANAVTEKSEGEIQFEYFYGDSLVPTSETTNALANGTVDVSFALLSYDPAKFPISSWIAEAEFLGNNSPDAGVLQKVGATLDWAMSNEEYLAELDQAGLFPLIARMPSHSSYGLMCTSENKSLEDVANKRVRVAGPAWSEEANNLGMVPVELPASESYTSFQQGLLDCFMGGATDVASLGLTQLGGSFNQAQLTGYNANGLLMSKATWEKLSPDLQDVLWDNLDLYLNNWYSNYRLKNFEFVEAAEENNVQIVIPDDEMEKRIKNHHEEVLEKVAHNAPAGVSDGAASVEDLKTKFEKWEGKVNDLGFSEEDNSWAEFASRVNGTPEDIGPFVEAVKTEVLDKHRPN